MIPTYINHIPVYLYVYMYLCTYTSQILCIIYKYALVGYDVYVFTCHTYVCVSVCTYLYMPVEWRVDPFVIKNKKQQQKLVCEKIIKGIIVDKKQNGLKMIF